MFDRTLTVATTLVAAFALALFAAEPAEAQIPEGDVEPVPTEDLETFAEIYLEVDEIRQDMEMEMAAAESPEEAQQLQQQANQLMTGVVEDHGMSIERYTEITQALNADPEQHQRFLAVLEEIENGPPN